MTKLTKYDVVDILLVCLSVSYIPMVLILFCMQMAMLVQDTGGRVFTDGMFLTILLFQFGYYFAGCIILYFLILKRAPIIKKLFPESESKEIIIPDGLVILTQYSFWIRLAGILILLSEGVGLIRGVSAEVIRSQMEERMLNLFAPGVQAFIGIGLGLLIIWKADWIAEKVNSITNYQSCREIISEENLAETNEGDKSPDATIEE